MLAAQFEVEERYQMKQGSARHAAVGANVPESVQISMRVQRGLDTFQRAFEACLDARSYSAK